MRTLRPGLAVLLCLCVFSLYAQNVGINEPNPLHSLEIKGSDLPMRKPLFVKDFNNNPLFSVSSFARVGINIEEPEATFHINSFSLNETVRIQAAFPHMTFVNSAGDEQAFFASAGGVFMLGSTAGSSLPVNIFSNGVPAATFLPNGFTGLGIQNPGFPLDVYGRVRLRHLNETAGMWFNNQANSGTAGFVGLQSDDNVGFYGSSAGWGFLMNTTNGNVGINTFAASAKLEVQGDGTGSTALKLGGGKIAYSGAGVNSATPVFVHKATTANTPSLLGYTVIDNPYCNSDPNAILIVTMNGTYGSGSGVGYTTVPEQISSGQVTSTTTFLVFFNGPSSGFYAGSPAYAKEKWCIRTYSGNLVSDPTNLNFNVMVVHPY